MNGIRPLRRALTGLALMLLGLTALACGGSTDDGGRVLILGIDGLEPQVVDLLMSEGKMPNFAKMRQQGAYGKLASQKPLLSPIIWTTIATGRGAEDHGIGHFVATANDTGEQIPASSDLRRVKAIWNIASEASKQVASVGWWATWPPETVNGSMVSDHTAYHFLFERGLTGDDESNKTYPPELAERIAPHLRRPKDLTFEELAPFVDITPEELDRPFDFNDELAHFQWALATAKSYRDIGLELWRADEPDLGLVYIEGTDSTSHLFGHLFRAEGLAGELAEQQKRFGRAVEEMYLFADRLVGEYLEALDDRSTLVVLSDHGFELGTLHDDPSKTRDLRRVSERFHRLHGILYLYGHRVKANARLDQASILDITPTVLALLGLPAAQNMPGRVLTEAFGEAIDTRRIASYEGDGGGTRAVTTGDDAVRQAQLKHLESLGYLGGDAPDAATGQSTASPQSDRNLAAIQFQQGRFEEAARIYSQLIQNNPKDAALRASLAGALGAMGRYDQALRELDRSIELAPLNVEAYHNRAVIRERRGELEAAIADYRTALRYQPQYEPSQRALYRLTGTIDVRTPTGEAEQRASQLVEQASLAARKTDYETAMKLLDEAEQVAPSFVLTYQYRSNVAYLMGDVEGAIAALEQGLAIEPDNALFATNLERLRAEPKPE
ncbi:MAG: alkaline phosphatase family protein [Acidobacteriota bacterium]